MKIKNKQVMKNIHLLPTNKSSRLWTNNLKIRLELDEFPSQHPTNVAKNLYITSDEKFIRDEYVTDGIEIIKATPKLVDAQGLINRRDWKKIILSTDQDLIADGVQPIDDEFLEWFVKNPTCEEVEIGNDYLKWRSSEEEKLADCHKIIIPKESVNHLTTEQITEAVFCNKQETLEEAGLKHCNMIDQFPALNNPLFSFKEGAKWQQAQDLFTNFSEITALQDDSGDWYVIPNELRKDFFKDQEDEDMVDSGEFDTKYGEYRTGGDLNIIQLFAKL
jgi:hypothetical protein